MHAGRSGGETEGGRDFLQPPFQQLPSHHELLFFSHSVMLTLCNPMDCNTPGFPVLYQLSKLAQTHVLWVGDAIQPSHPLSSPSPPALNPSQHQGLFQWVGSSHQVAKVVEFSLSISPSNEHPGLISFRMDWLDLLAVQGTLKSLLQHHSSKASILWYSAFSMVQLSHPYMTTGKTIALTRWTFVDKVMSLFFNMLSRFVIAFLPRSKCLLISWLQSPSAVILEPKKIKAVTVPIMRAPPNLTLTSSLLPGCSVVKNLSANSGDSRDVGWIPVLGRSPGVGSGNSL